MFDSLLPKRADNAFRGHRLALWLLGIVLFIRLAMGLNCIFNGYEVAMSADGIPLASFTPAGAQTVVALFASWGLAQLLIAAIGIAALVRYRNLVPFLFLLLLLEQLGRRAIHYFIPTVRVGSPPAVYVNVILLALMVAGLALSMWRRVDSTLKETA